MALALLWRQQNVWRWCLWKTGSNENATNATINQHVRPKKQATMNKQRLQEIKNQAKNHRTPSAIVNAAFLRQKRSQAEKKHKTKAPNNKTTHTTISNSDRQQRKQATTTTTSSTSKNYGANPPWPSRRFILPQVWKLWQFVSGADLFLRCI